MSLLEQIDNDFTKALKSKNETEVSVLRMLKSALKNKQIALKTKKLSDEQVGEVVSKEVKQRKDSAEQFKKGRREDLAKKEEAEIKFLEKYLPEQLSEDKVAKIIDQAISETGASSLADMGKVMGAIMPQVKGKADGFLVSKMVKDKLGK